MKLQDVYAVSQRIELRRSRIAQRLNLAFYTLILVSITMWAIPIVWKSSICLFVLLCYLWDYWRSRRRINDADVEAIVLSSDGCIKAVQSSARLCPIRSFKVEQIVGYYIQIYLCDEDGNWLRLFIFPDSMDENAFHQMRCLGVQHQLK